MKNIYKSLSYYSRLLAHALFRRGDEKTQCDLAEKLTRWFYPRYRFNDYGRLFLYDESFLADCARFAVSPRTMERRYVVWQTMKLVRHVPGDTAECGAYKGATSFLICKGTLGSGKPHHVFDSFEGLSTPSAADGDHWERGNLAAAEAVVRANLSDFDFVQYHSGWIPERFPDVADRTFSFVHVDVDLYQPTRDSVAFFYPRMLPGGIIMLDDYGFLRCPGARQATDEIMADKREEIVLLPTGQAFIQKQ
jgi:hypothetical protein